MKKTISILWPKEFFLSYKLQDFPLFVHELKLLLAQLLIQNEFSPKRERESVKFVETERPVFIDFKENKETLLVYWNQEVWKNIFFEGKSDSNHEKKIMNQLVNVFKRHPFFNLKFKKKIKSRAVLLKIQQYTSLYFKELQKNEREKKVLEIKRKEALLSFRPTISKDSLFSFYKTYKKNIFEKKYVSQRKELEEEFQKRVSSWEPFLKKNRHWETFKKRIFFQRSLVDLHKVLFQYRKT